MSNMMAGSSMRFLQDPMYGQDIDALVEQRVQELARQQGFTYNPNNPGVYAQGSTNFRGDVASALVSGGRDTIRRSLHQSFQDQFADAALRDFQVNQQTQEENWQRNTDAIGQLAGLADTLPQGMRDMAGASADALVGDANQINAIADQVGGQFNTQIDQLERLLAQRGGQFDQLVRGATQTIERSIADFETALVEDRDRSQELFNSVAEGIQANARDSVKMLQKGIGPDGQPIPPSVARQSMIELQDTVDRQKQATLAPMMVDMNNRRLQNAQTMSNLRQQASGLLGQLGQLTTGQLGTEAQTRLEMGRVILGSAEVQAQVRAVANNARYNAEMIRNTAQLNAAQMEAGLRGQVAEYTMANPYSPASFLDVMSAIAAARTNPSIGRLGPVNFGA